MVAAPGGAWPSHPTTFGIQGLLISGWFHVIWVDGPAGSKIAGTEYILIDEHSQWTRVLFDENLVSPLGDPLAMNGQRVIIRGRTPMMFPDGARTRHGFNVGASSIEFQSLENLTSFASGYSSAAVIGPQPFVTLLCRFSDLSGITPHDVGWFQGLMSSNYPGIDNYWQEVSNNAISLAGSSVAGWYNLPQPRSYYLPGGVLDTQRALNDCTNAANADVFFPNYVGINLMFNDSLDFTARGGRITLTRDGQTRTYAVTWMPTAGPGCWPAWEDPLCQSAAYENQGVLAHEMGHGFGLPHSSGPYAQTFDSNWDVMSNPTRTYCCPRPALHPEYGHLGVHTISYHMDRLGWIPAGKKFTASGGGQATVHVERLSLPQTSNYRMAQIPIGNSTTKFYTVEARRFAGYDTGLPPLPGEAIIIHSVDTTRNDRLAQVVDVDGNGNPNDAAAMWLPGETFTDSTNGIAVCIESATTSGFVVTIAREVSPTCFLEAKLYLPVVNR